ncbi:conserved domain protein [Actinomyces sp. oral taxon 175 str. F0384]|nr:conserved domain protein [Actinomyces sp. oral taxon 175 str. F0384]
MAAYARGGNVVPHGVARRRRNAAGPLPECGRNATRTRHNTKFSCPPKVRVAQALHPVNRARCQR